MSKKRITILVSILVILIIILVYILFPSQDKGSQNVITSSQLGGDSSVLSESQEFLKALSVLREIKIDTGFFDDSVFRSLKEFPVELEPEEVGRTNPFSPLE